MQEAPFRSGLQRQASSPYIDRLIHQELGPAQALFLQDQIYQEACSQGAVSRTGICFVNPAWMACPCITKCFARPTVRLRCNLQPFGVQNAQLKLERVPYFAATLKVCCSKCRLTASGGNGECSGADGPVRRPECVFPNLLQWHGRHLQPDAGGQLCLGQVAGNRSLLGICQARLSSSFADRSVTQPMNASPLKDMSDHLFAVIDTDTWPGVDIC